MEHLDSLVILALAFLVIVDIAVQMELMAQAALVGILVLTERMAQVAYQVIADIQDLEFLGIADIVEVAYRATVAIVEAAILAILEFLVGLVNQEQAQVDFLVIQGLVVLVYQDFLVLADTLVLEYQAILVTLV